MFETLFLPFCATTNPENIGRLLRTIRLQRELDRHLGRRLPHKRTLFTDKVSRLPMDAIQFFDGGVFESHPFRSTASGPRFSVSMLRNEAIRYGRSIAPAWTMFCDSDTIILPDEFVPPQRDFAVPNVYYQENEAESAVASIARLKAGGKSLFADGNSWFILSRELLATFLYNEDFYGYGWEDNEFEFRISGSGSHVEVVDVTVIHSFHPHAERRIDATVMENNKALALAMRWLIEHGTLDPSHPVPHLKVYDVIHPAWRSKVVLCPARQQVIRLEPRNIARYERNGDTVRIQWPFYKAEQFRLIDGRLIEVSLLSHGAEKLASLGNAAD